MSSQNLVDRRLTNGMAWLNVAAYIEHRQHTHTASTGLDQQSINLINTLQPPPSIPLPLSLSLSVCGAEGPRDSTHVHVIPLTTLDSLNSVIDVQTHAASHFKTTWL